MERKSVLASICIATLLMAGSCGTKSPDSKDTMEGEDNKGIKLELKENSTGNEKASDVFAVNGTQGELEGLKTLTDAMGDEGIKFYKSNTKGKDRGEDGLIACDDVVLIEINCQWNERGGTNTDLLKSLIQMITAHPDGFNGEIIVADNGQAQYGGTGKGGSMDWGVNNAVDRSQSVQKVVNSFSENYSVSAVLWDEITEKEVREYSQGDREDGFILNSTPDPETGILVTYPKFTTKYGTCVSFKNGIWDESSKQYDNEKLKVINMPVLKTHSIYYVTACIKNYMGTTSDKITKHNAHNSIGQGGMGTQMAETRVPVLNILDAIWINPFRGPRTSDSNAVYTGIIAAGTDPVAVDYWAAKNILMKAAEESGNLNLGIMDPDGDAPGTFGYWLRLSMEEIKRAGYQSTMDMDEINVYVNG